MYPTELFCIYAGNGEADQMNALRHKMDLVVRFTQSTAEDYLSQYLKQQLDVVDKILNGSPYYASTFYVPSEILALFDLQVLFIERIAGFGAANSIFKGIETLRLKSGMPSKACTYQILFNSLVDEGLLPVPQGLIGASYACDDAWAYLRGISLKYRIPFHFIDVFHQSSGDCIGYLSTQLKDLYEVLKTKFKMKGTLEEVVYISNRSMDIKSEIDSLRLRYPGVLGSMDGFKLFTLYNDLGKASALSVLESLLFCLKEKSKDFNIKKTKKLLWLGILPLYQNRLILEIEKKYGCLFVYEELFDFTQHKIMESAFFEDLAKRIVSSVFFSTEERVNSIIKWAKLFEIEGIVHFSQRNCRFLPPMVHLLRRRLEIEGIPFVEIHGDAIDPAFYNEREIWDRLDVFFEMML